MCLPGCDRGYLRTRRASQFRKWSFDGPGSRNLDWLAIYATSPMRRFRFVRGNQLEEGRAVGYSPRQFTRHFSDPIGAENLYTAGVEIGVFGERT